MEGTLFPVCQRGGITSALALPRGIRGELVLVARVGIGQVTGEGLRG
jgi:hypothetical protein